MWYVFRKGNAPDYEETIIAYSKDSHKLLEYIRKNNLDSTEHTIALNSRNYRFSPNAIDLDTSTYTTKVAYSCPKQKEVQMTFFMPESLHTMTKVTAAKNNTTMKEVMTNALRSYIKQECGVNVN
jgi:hypothetical protein